MAAWTPIQHTDSELEADNNSVLYEELQSALEYLPLRKEPQMDNIPSELIQHAESGIRNRLYEIINKIAETKQWPKKFFITTLIPIPKRYMAKTCADYRTISLLYHASTILLCIIDICQ